MAYSQKDWANDAAGGTPITAAELNRMEQGIADAQNKIGIQIWNGTFWSVRPTDVMYVEAYSDGTAGSTRDPNAPPPAGGVNGDRWWAAPAV